MACETMQACRDALSRGNIQALDITGGAPELNANFRWLVVIARARVATSPRRWQRLGPWRVTWTNQLIVLGRLLPGRFSRSAGEVVPER
ncbi:MAG: hypothetical protein ACYC0X_11975 [Pirellulaceae bacterium]